MAGPSGKEPEDEVAAAAAKEEQRRQIRCLMYHICANVTTLTIPIQAGPKTVGDLYGGDFAKGAKFLGMCSAGTAAFEFLFNPTVGCWSDAHGRRPTLLVGPVVCAATGVVYALAPQGLPIIAFARVVGNGCNAISGSTTTLAALTDVCKGDQKMMTEALAMFGTWVGLGVIVGPAIGGAILARWGDKAVYAGRAAFSVAHLAWLARSMPETLRPEKRRPFDGKPVSPFSFLGLFTRTAMLRKLTVYNMLGITNEGKCVNDLNQLWMKGNLKWSVGQTATWTMSSGLLGMIAGAFFAKPMLKHLGPRGATSVAALFGILSFCLKGASADGASYWAGSVAALPFMGGGGSMKSAATKHAIAAGMGAGQYSGMYANLRALIYVVGPLLYTRLYAYQVARGRNPGMAYLAGAVISCLIPELMHRMWSDRELYPWNFPKDSTPRPAPEAERRQPVTPAPTAGSKMG